MFTSFSSDLIIVEWTAAGQAGSEESAGGEVNIVFNDKANSFESSLDGTSSRV